MTSNKWLDFVGDVDRDEDTGIFTRSSADAENLAQRNVIRREEKYRQVLRRRTAISYAEGVNVSAGRRVIQHCRCSAFFIRPKMS